MPDPPCYFCRLELQARLVFVDGDDAAPRASRDQWVQMTPRHLVFFACNRHWQQIAERGVTFDGSGVPSIRRPVGEALPLPPDVRFLPLVEQMYAREWLLERVVKVQHDLIELLEGEPAVDTGVQHALLHEMLHDFEAELEGGPVRV